MSIDVVQRHHVVDLHGGGGVLTSSEGDPLTGVGILERAGPNSGVGARSRALSTSLLTILRAVGSGEIGIREISGQDLVTGVAAVTVNVRPGLSEPAGAGSSLAPGLCSRSILGQFRQCFERRPG